MRLGTGYGTTVRQFTICRASINPGTGQPAYTGWLTVQGERIAALGPGDPPRAARPRLDAGGWVLCPGFVDLHGHTDALVLANPTLESKLRQGVTTEVGGNCGLSVWPPSEGLQAELAPWEQAFGRELAVPDLPTFARRLAESGLAANYALLAGHGNLRAQAMGYQDRPATGPECERMAGLLRELLSWGTWGLSFGLAYPPGMFADTGELAALGRVVAGRGLLAFHLRSESAQGVEATAEAIAVGAETGTAVHLSHHKALGRANWGKVAQSLALISEARARGQAVTADVYPYTATATGLAAYLPKWAQEGGNDALLGRLRQPGMRRAMAREMAERLGDAQLMGEILVARTFHPAGRELEGLSLAQVAARQQVDPGTALFALLLADGGRTEIVRCHGMSERDVEQVITHPATAIASDATARTLAGPLAEGKPHPRAFGTFPRVLGRYVRERGVISLEEAIRKMTSLPAQILGLPDRGRLEVGCQADLVLFDPHTIADQATFTEPVQPPRGIAGVWVNGEQVLEGGQLTGARPGRLLLRQG